MTRLFDLSEDIFVQICGYLDARTLWKLIVSCKSLYQLIKCRAIWVDQLNRLLSEYAVVDGTYDIPAMSTSEIRKAATRPYRFEQAVQFEEVKPIQYQTTITDEIFEEIKLAPGGRWLVTLSLPTSGRGSKFCRIWDLHSSAPVSEPYAALAIEEERIGRDLVLRPDSEGKTFQIVFSARAARQAHWRIYIVQFDHLIQDGHRLRQLDVFEASDHGSEIKLVGDYITSWDAIIKVSKISSGSNMMYKAIGDPGSGDGWSYLSFGPEGFAAFDNAYAEIKLYGPIVVTDADQPIDIIPVPGMKGCISFRHPVYYCGDLAYSFGGTRGSSALLCMHDPIYATSRSFYVEFKDSPLQISDLRLCICSTAVGYHDLVHAKTIGGLVVVVDGPFNLAHVHEDGRARFNRLPQSMRSRIPLDNGKHRAVICPTGGVVGSVIRKNEVWVWRVD